MNIKVIHYSTSVGYINVGLIPAKSSNDSSPKITKKTQFQCRIFSDWYPLIDVTPVNLCWQGRGARWTSLVAAHKSLGTAS